MNTLPEETGTAPATATAGKAKPGKKTARAPRRAPVAATKAKSGQKANSAKKAPKGGRRAEAAKTKNARDGSKTAGILDLLKRPGGVTSKELMKVTGWLPHSVRGFLSGTVGKKMGLTLTSAKTEDGERTYCVEA